MWGRGRDCAVYDSGRFEMGSGMDWKPVELFKKTRRMSLTIGLKDNAGESVLDALQLEYGRVR